MCTLYSVSHWLWIAIVRNAQPEISNIFVIIPFQSKYSTQFAQRYLSKIQFSWHGNLSEKFLLLIHSVGFNRHATNNCLRWPTHNRCYASILWFQVDEKNQMRYLLNNIIPLERRLWILKFETVLGTIGFAVICTRCIKNTQGMIN